MIKQENIKTKENQYGIKIDDIFCLVDHGISLTADFFQVVELKGKSKVVIKEIEFEKVEQNGEKFMVMPCKNKFQEIGNHIEDNNVGETKIVKKDIDCNGKDEIYISIGLLNCPGYRKYAYLWDGKPKEYYINYLY